MPKINYSTLLSYKNKLIIFGGRLGNENDKLLDRFFSLDLETN